MFFGAYKQSAAASFFLTPPEGVWELSLGIYLIVKGFQPSQVLYDDGRHTGVNGPLIPVPGIGAARGVVSLQRWSAERPRAAGRPRRPARRNSQHSSPASPMDRKR